MTESLASSRRPRSRTRLALAGVVLCIGVGLVGASASSGALQGNQASAAKGTIVWAVPGDVSGTDPENNGQDLSQSILALTYQHLVTLGDGLHISPELAESWTQPDAATYVFHLRPNVRFSNGRLLEAADVVGSFDRILSKAEGSYLAGRLTSVKNVTALNKSTVQFKLSAPSAAFLPALAYPAAAILPMKELNAGTFDPNKQLLGTGPFVAQSHQLNASWTFVPNRHYWVSGEPKVSKVQINVIPDESTEIAALRGGTANVAIFQSADVSKLLAGVPSVKSVVQSGTEQWILVVNDVSPGPLTNVLLRRAINQGLSRKAIASVALSGLGKPVGPASGTPASCSVSALKYSQFNAAAAQANVQAAGATGVKITLQYSPIYPDAVSMAQVIQSQLANVGIAVTLDPLSPGEFGNNFVGGNFDLSIVFYGTGTDPYFGLINWNPALAGYTAKFNAPVAAFNALLPKIASTTNATKRKSLIQQACMLIDADSAQLPVLSKVQTIAYRTDLLNAKVLSAEDASNPMRGIETWTTTK